MDFMKKILLSFFMSLLLLGCATAPVVPVPKGLWYADNEDPGSRYHVYVYFKDASSFIWWRTTEAQAVVFKRWAYYTNDHPGVDNPVIFTRKGDWIKGERHIVNKNSEGVLQLTVTQTFTGYFSGDSLEMEQSGNSVWADGTPAPHDTVRWSLKRLSAQ
jgi:hypothetical protein